MRIIPLSTTTSHIHTTPLCACIGYFDGMHLGHQALIGKTLELAEKHDCRSALITFDPDPVSTITGQTVHHITTLRQRMNLAVQFGIENIIILQFTKEMCEMSPEDFVANTLHKINLKGLVCGFDFHYGYKGAGNSEMLKQMMDCEVSIVDPVCDEKGKISSTRICAALAEGEMDDANAMLGYPYFLEGTVIHGNHKGTGMGFPTANVSCSAEYLLPKTGVYAGRASIGGRVYRAMINIGHNPTFNYSQMISVEAHIIDFHETIYGKHIRLSLTRYIRPEIRFKNRDNLSMQLYQDLRDVNRILDLYE